MMDFDGGPSTSSDANSVFITNMQWWTTDVELEQACSQYGQVAGIRFIEDRACGKSRGMAVVDFTHPQAAQACIDGMNGMIINGRPCRVQKQMQRPMPGGRGGGGMMHGGRGGRGGGGRGGGMDPSMMMMGGMPPPPQWGMPPPQMMMGMAPPGMGGGGGFRPPPPPGMPGMQ